MQDNNDIALAIFAVLILMTALILIFVGITISKSKSESESESESKSESESESIGGDALRRKERHMATEENESRASRDRLALETLISSLFLYGDILFEDGDDPKLVVNNADRTEISLTKAGARALREAGIPTREELEKEDEGDGLCDDLDDDISHLKALIRSDEARIRAEEALIRTEEAALRYNEAFVRYEKAVLRRCEEGKGTMAEETEQKECAKEKAHVEEAATALKNAEQALSAYPDEKGDLRNMRKEGEIPDPK